MAVLRFDVSLVVQEVRDAIEDLPFSLEEWLDDKDQDFAELEDLDPIAREDASYMIGRLRGAADACGVTMRELVDLAMEIS